MENLNAEEVKKALECCLDDENCDECPLGIYPTSICKWNCMEDALALIKQLTEENERLRAESDDLAITVKDLRFRNKELARSNKSLSGYVEKLQFELAGCVQIKADTVRKMHSEIEARCIKGGIYHAFVARTIDQIAKEMLEERDES